MPRERLPDRRQAETVDLWHGGRRYHLTVGEYPDGTPGEVFIHGATPGSDSNLLYDDIGVLISRLLQHGDTPDALAAGLGRLGDGQRPRVPNRGRSGLAGGGRTDDEGDDPYGHRYPCRGHEKP